MYTYRLLRASPSHLNIFVRGAGDNLYMNFGCVVLDCAAVTLGDNVMFGPNVQLYAATHPTEPQLRLEGKEMAYPITMGNNVWIGGCAIVCPGVTIGDDTTIGAGSVVTKVGSPHVTQSLSQVAFFGRRGLAYPAKVAVLLETHAFYR